MKTVISYTAISILISSSSVMASLNDYDGPGGTPQKKSAFLAKREQEGSYTLLTPNSKAEAKALEGDAFERQRQAQKAEYEKKKHEAAIASNLLKEKDEIQKRELEERNQLLAKLKASNIEKETELQTLREKLSTLTQASTFQAREKQQIEAQQDETLRKLGEFQAALTEEEKKVARLQQQAETLAQDKTASEGTRLQLEKDLKTAQTNADSQRAMRDKYKTAYQEVSRELTTITSKLLDTEKTVATLKADLERKEHELGLAKQTAQLIVDEATKKPVAASGITSSSATTSTNNEDDEFNIIAKPGARPAKK